MDNLTIGIGVRDPGSDGPSAAVDLRHQGTERLTVFGAQRRQVRAGIRKLPINVVAIFFRNSSGDGGSSGRVGHGILFRW